MDNSTTTKQVADLVAAAIARSGETKSSVAQKALIPRTTLHRKMSGSGEFSVTELAAIASVVGVNLIDLIPAEVRTIRAA